MPKTGIDTYSESRINTYFKVRENPSKLLFVELRFDGQQETMKVLIVDDNQRAREMIRKYLRGLSDDFDECDDGFDALAFYEETRPDWVLMDWEMKRMNGLEAIRNIIEKYPQAKILMVTNYDGQNLRRAAHEAGAKGFVTKDDLQALRPFLD